jgi:hypothetical protein
MKTINLDPLTPEQKVVVEMVINEGMMRGYEDILTMLEAERFKTASEDPYYGEYVKLIFDMISERYNKFKIDTYGEAETK